MRRVFIPACVLVGVLVVLQVLSLFNLSWLSADRSVRVALVQGCVSVWRGSAGDFQTGGTGLHVGGWSGGATWWSPEIDRPTKGVWVPTTVTLSGAKVMRQISGRNTMLPVVYLLAVALALLGGSVRPWIRHRRVVRGLCGACGYDQRGVQAARCPECGTIVRRIWTRIVGRLMGGAVGA